MVEDRTTEHNSTTAPVSAQCSCSTASAAAPRGSQAGKALLTELSIYCTVPTAQCHPLTAQRRSSSHFVSASLPSRVRMSFFLSGLPLTVFHLVVSYVPLAVKLGRLVHLSHNSPHFDASCFSDDHLVLTESAADALARSSQLRLLLAQVRSVSLTGTVRDSTSCDRIVQAFARADSQCPLLPGLRVAIVELLVDVSDEPTDGVWLSFAKARQQAHASVAKLLEALGQLTGLHTLSLALSNPPQTDLESLTDDAVAVALTRHLRSLRILRLQCALSLHGLRLVLSLPLQHLDLYECEVCQNRDFRGESTWPAAGGKLLTLLLPYSALDYEALMRAARVQLTSAEQGGEQQSGIRHLSFGRWGGPAVDHIPFLTSFRSLTALDLHPLEGDFTPLTFLWDKERLEPRLPLLSHFGYDTLGSQQQEEEKLEEADRLSVSLLTFLHVYGRQLKRLRLSVWYSSPTSTLRLFDQRQRVAASTMPHLAALLELDLCGVCEGEAELMTFLSLAPQLRSLTLDRMQWLELTSLQAIGRTAPQLQWLHIHKSSPYIFEVSPAASLVLDTTPCLQQLRLLEIIRYPRRDTWPSLSALPWLALLLARHTSTQFAALHLDKCLPARPVWQLLPAVQPALTASHRDTAWLSHQAVAALSP